MPRLISACGMSVPGDVFSKLKPIPFSLSANTGDIGPRNSVRAAVARQLKRGFFRISSKFYLLTAQIESGAPLEHPRIARTPDRISNTLLIAKRLRVIVAFQFSSGRR